MLARGSLAAVMLVVGCGRIGYGGDGGEVDAGVDPGIDGRILPSVIDAAAFERCGPDEIACGNFEDGLGAWAARGNVGATTVGIVGDPVADGRGALRIRTDLDGDGFAAAERRFTPIFDGALHGRVMLWVGSSTVIDDFVVALQLDDGDDLGTQKLSFDLLPYGGFVLTATTATPPVRPGSPPDALRRDAWTCLTFRIDLGRRGSVEVRDRGRRLVTLDAIDTVPDRGFQRILLAAVAPELTVSDLAFDQVSLSRRPVACP